ncbi:MAG: hypothetical protein DMG65_02050 [Candidatus Angelobacter sp. Gp1-AA117]|nr:MAG: hypothetical protein DMG65_02050 [Candidatus Angelobacter sp. Gp1-AA117]
MSYCRFARLDSSSDEDQWRNYQRNKSENMKGIHTGKQPSLLKHGENAGLCLVHCIGQARSIMVIEINP